MVRFTQTGNFRIDKIANFASQDAFAIFRTPDEMIAYFVGDMLGMLLFHTI